MRSIKAVFVLLLIFVTCSEAVRTQRVLQEKKKQNEPSRQTKQNAPEFILQKYTDFATKDVDFKIRHGVQPSFIRFYPSKGAHNHCQYTFTVNHVTPAEGLFLARLYLFKINHEHNRNVSVYDASDNTKISFLTIANKKRRWVVFPLENSFIKRYGAKLPGKIRIVFKIQLQEGFEGNNFFKTEGAWLALFTRPIKKISLLKDSKHPATLLTPSTETFQAAPTDDKVTTNAVNEKGCQRKDMLVNASDLGMDWIVQPRVMNLYMCQGQCAFAQHFAENEFLDEPEEKMQQLSYAISRRSCAPTEKKPLAILTANDGGQFIISWINNMMIARCGCR